MFDRVTTIKNAQVCIIHDARFLTSAAARGCEISSIVVQIWSTCNNFVICEQIGQHIIVHQLLYQNYATPGMSRFCTWCIMLLRAEQLWKVMFTRYTWSTQFLSRSAYCLSTCSSICHRGELLSVICAKVTPASPNQITWNNYSQ